MTGGEEPGQIPRPGTASANCPDVLVRREDILLITRQGNRPGKWMSDQSIHIRVEDVDALIEMLILGKQEAVRRGQQEAVRRRRESGAG
jgi:hypothetical protein